MSDDKYGWAAVPRAQKQLLSTADLSKTTPLDASEVSIPASALARQVYDYAKAELSEETFNHSMRIFYYGMAP